MKVHELIAHLSTCPSEMEVVVYSTIEGDEVICHEIQNATGPHPWTHTNVGVFGIEVDRDDNYHI